VYVAVIDDDESVRRTMSRLLRAAGFQPITFGSAEEFLADPVRPHFTCLLVDVRLGGMSGIDMWRRLVAEGSRTPVIFITAHDEPAERAQAIQSGCAGFFRKTDAGARIIETIRSVVPS
jgi:FixJ family two-component response regulator